MKISKLDIYTIEEIQLFIESNIVLDLPALIQDIIADFYIFNCETIVFYEN